MAKREYKIVKLGVDDSIAVVPLGKDSKYGECVLDKDDMDKLLRMGVSTNWTLNCGKSVVASAKSSNSHVSIARAIMGAGAGERVKHLDGNIKNLRRSNLQIRRGPGLKMDSLYIGVRLHG